MQNTFTLRGRDLASLPARVLTAGAAVLMLAGCMDTDRILQVEEREFPTDETLANPAALPLLVRGALGEFFRGYSGSGLDNLGWVSASGLFTDEFESVDTFVDRNAMDQRNLQPPAIGNASNLAYSRLQRARRAAKDAAVAVEGVLGANHAQRGTMLAIEGYSILTLAEGWCGAVPLSNIVGGAFVEGNPLTTDQLVDSAIARFDAALAAAPNDLARVGRGRALLFANRPAEAAAAVSAVGNTFVFRVEHSENTFQNPVWNLNNSNRRYRIAHNEGGNGMPFRGGTGLDPAARDPRTPWEFNNRLGFDDAYPLYEQLKYPNRDADVVLADWREARLIEAEAALRANNFTLFMDRLNTLRAGVTGLAPLTDPGTPAGRVDLLFRERAFWLYATGHRLGDMRRLVHHYGRAINTVYPTGEYFRGGTYGNDVVFSVPFNEEQNELFKREQCVTTRVWN